MASTTQDSQGSVATVEGGSNNGLLFSSRFLQRVYRLPLVNSAFTAASNSYLRMKGATPALVRPAVDTAEGLSCQLLDQTISVIHRLPLPLYYADDVACAGLDQFENVANLKDSIIKRLQAMHTEGVNDAALTEEDRTFYLTLLRFASTGRAMAVQSLRCNFDAFLDGQLRLLEMVCDAVDGLGQKDELSKSNPTPESEREGQVDVTTRIQRIKRVFEEIMQQRNIVAWIQGCSNPLEPVWGHLQYTVNRLTPNEATIASLQDKLHFIRVILRSVIEQVKLAAKDPESAWSEMRYNVYHDAMGFLNSWLPSFAIRGLQRMTGLQIEAAQNEMLTNVKNASTTTTEEESNTEAAGATDTPKKKRVTLVEPTTVEHYDASEPIIEATSTDSQAEQNMHTDPTVEEESSEHTQPKQDESQNEDISAEAAPVEVQENGQQADDTEEVDNGDQAEAQPTAEFDTSTTNATKRRAGRRRKNKTLGE